MHYYPSTYGEVCDCVMQQKYRAAMSGRDATKLVIGRFQHQALIDEIKTWPLVSIPRMVQGPSEFMGLPYEVRGEFECAVLVA